MIASIQGTVLDVGDTSAIIETGGIGYSVTMTSHELALLPRDGTPVRMYTHLQVREDGWALYGFTRRDDLEIFRALTTVTRIGPALAISVLSQIRADDLVRAIVGEQEQVLVSLSGIGKRNARRLIVELKDQFEKRQERSLRDRTPSPGEDGRKDAVSALIALGFEPKSAFEAVLAVSAEKGTASAPDLVREALPRLRRGSP